MISTIFILLAIFQLKHFLADYPLQRPWMLGKFLDKGWVFPLAMHCLVHAACTLVIGLVCPWVPIYLAIIGAVFDFVLHFTMDRIKASKKLLGRFTPLTGTQYTALMNTLAGKPAGAPIPIKEVKARLRSNRWFWHSLGIDQMVHHLTHYAIIFLFILPLL